MTKMLEPTLSEIREEAVITKRILERVPAEKLSWKPHQKSMSLGQLAFHVASIPGSLSKLLQQNEFNLSQANFDPPPPKNLEEIHATHDQSMREAEDFLSGMTEQAAMAPWRLTMKGQQIFSKPRVAVLRSIMLNHGYHHRGQLSDYLRLLEVPVPVIYGRSADENPFA
jgi:uncharacterized damage-inducible protein DinB